MPPATGTHRSDFGLCLDQSAVGIPVLQVGEDVNKGKMNEDKLIQNIKKYELVSEIFEVINKE